MNGGASASFGEMTFFGGVDGVKDGESTLNLPRPKLLLFTGPSAGLIPFCSYAESTNDLLTPFGGFDMDVGSWLKAQPEEKLAFLFRLKGARNV